MLDLIQIQYIAAIKYTVIFRVLCAEKGSR